MSHYFHRKISHQNSCKYLVIESSLPAVTGQSRMQITTFIGSNFAANQQYTPPLLYSSLNTTKIIQSQNLTDAITDDSYSKVRLASTM